MKIGICISGICRGNLEKNIQSIKNHFSGDYFYGTWDTHVLPKYLKDANIFYIKEPTMDYHPILDVDDLKAPKLKTIKKQMTIPSNLNTTEYRNRTLHHTKQILIHNEMMKKIDSSYDMIIRLRYDTFLSSRVDLNSYLKKSYKDNIAIGFGTRTSRHKNINILYEIPKIYPTENPPASVSQDWGWYLMDPLIFHPRNLWDTNLVDRLHKEKKLLPAEYGWYQILSEPYGDNHLSVYGGAQIEKYL